MGGGGGGGFTCHLSASVVSLHAGDKFVTTPFALRLCES